LQYGPLQALDGLVDPTQFAGDYGKDYLASRMSANAIWTTQYTSGDLPSAFESVCSNQGLGN
jgi:hypothetical protein